jgi:phospholipase/lecithinase/hemolysin
MRERTRKLVATILLLCVAQAKCGAVVLTGLVAFGDSLSDVGNMYDLVVGLGGQAAAIAVGINPNFYDVGRWSNGPLWVEDVNNRLGFTNLTQNNGTDASGLDFAWGGATSGSGYSYTVLNNLLTQVGNYSSLLGTNPAQLPNPATTLYTVWAGGNDVTDYVGGNTSVTPNSVAANLATAITSLYNDGGRYFLVPNLPPLGNKPDYLNTGNETIANDFVTLYNTDLANTLSGLEVSLPDVTIVSYDVHGLFEDVLANPGSYGISNVTAPAFVNDPDGSAPFGSVVSNPNNYLFWDNTHPTTTIQMDMGEQVYDAVIAAIPEPAMGVWLGGVGVVLMLARRRR